MDEAAQLPDCGFVEDVRGVRVADLVAMGVVAAVVGHPADNRALDPHRTGNGEAYFQPSVGLEGPVGEQAMEPDGKAVAGNRVKDDPKD
jgi:hypothetical protein